ncbi:major facilitator superfamily transporter [Niveomyces insectorum RCEF 264]|uniref:Major facilitator superfamily transporter n=1 Tax=Niveomyces insectorum RCEF 264 TaxID=1081102 RepID=A0A167SL24_9HYPO|nr:major facilitator superfamily transporter [Niveomyces insectorum RCEF 264]
MSRDLARSGASTPSATANSSTKSETDIASPTIAHTSNTSAKSEADMASPTADSGHNDGDSSEVNDDDDEAHDHDGTLQIQSSRTESIWAAEHMSLPREILFVGICCSAQIATQAGFLMMLMLLHVIGDSFGISNPARLSWAVAGYSLTVGTFILVSGRLGDTFGHKKVLIVGFLWYALWSLVAGVSVYSNYVLFVFARVLQGIGPALCLASALALLGAAYPPGHRKAMVFSLFGASAPFGAVAGAAVGSALALAWWPWVFWSSTIVLTLLAATSYLVIPSTLCKPSPPRSARRLWVELDVVGTLIGVPAMVLFNFAWNQAPLSGWGTPEVIVTLVLGLALIFVFFVFEMRYAEAPLLPFDAINLDVAFVLTVVVLGWATFGIWSLYLIQMSQLIRHNSPTLTTAWMSPVVVAGLFASLLTGTLLGPLKVTPPVVMSIALSMFMTGAILIATLPTTQIYWAQFFVATLVTPFGMDMSFPAATLIVSNAVKKKHQGVAASLINTVVNYGISLGVGFAGTIEVHVNNGGKTEADLLKGFRGALYFGIGLSGLGVVICFIFVAREYRRKRDKV